MIQPGDELYLIQIYDDGWSLCDNLSNAKGVVPLNCLAPIPSSSQQAQSSPQQQPALISPTLPSFLPSSGSNGILHDVMNTKTNSNRMSVASTVLPQQQQQYTNVTIPQVKILQEQGQGQGQGSMSAGGSNVNPAPSYAEAVGEGSGVPVLREKGGLVPEAR